LREFLLRAAFCGIHKTEKESPDTDTQKKHFSLYLPGKIRTQTKTCEKISFTTIETTLSMKHEALSANEKLSIFCLNIKL